MNDEQLAQLFAAQKIPPASDDAKNAALTAAMQAFAQQNTATAPEQITSSVTAATTAGEASLPTKLFTRLTTLVRSLATRHTGRFRLKSRAASFSGWIAVAGLHIGVVLALMIGLQRRGEMVIIENVKVEAVEDLQEKVAPPPPPPPDYVPPPPDFTPPPQFNVAADAPAPVNAITSMPAKAAEAAPVMAKAPPTPARAAKKGLAPPPYPIESKRLGEEGVVELALYLTAEGKVQEGRIETSSGFARLDQAALKHAMTNWKFEPCKQEGKAIACWHKIKFRFQLKDS